MPLHLRQETFVFKDLTQTEVAEELGMTQKKVSRESIKALGRLKQVLG